MTRTALLACISLSTLLLAGAFASSDQWGLALLSLAIGFAWLLIERRGRRQVASLVMASLSVLAAVAIISGSLPQLMALVEVLALSAWDLSRFRQRLADAGQEDSRRGIERNHLRRLLLVDAAGLLLAVLAMSFQLRLGFYVLLTLGGSVLLALYGMLGLIAGWGRETEQRSDG